DSRQPPKELSTLVPRPPAVTNFLVHGPAHLARAFRPALAGETVRAPYRQMPPPHARLSRTPGNLYSGLHTHLVEQLGVRRAHTSPLIAALPPVCDPYVPSDS